MRVTKKSLVLAVCLGCGMVATGFAADSTPVNPSTSASYDICGFQTGYLYW